MMSFDITLRLVVVVDIGFITLCLLLLLLLLLLLQKLLLKVK